MSFANKNELTRPAQAISGQNLAYLKVMLESALDGVEVKDLDLAMLMNVPVNRLGQLKRAKSSIDVLGKTDSTVDVDEELETRAVEVPSLRPSQAILVRLLLKYPHYAQLLLRPTNPEVFDLIAPFMLPEGRGVSNGSARPKKSGFAPLFGRSYISSYKMLAEDSSSSVNSSIPVTRLQMLVVGKFGELFKRLLSKYQKEQGVIGGGNEIEKFEARGWAVLREQDSLTSWMSDETYEAFFDELSALWGDWFQKHYLQVLRDEAVSRDLDPESALGKGNWTNTEKVAETELRKYTRNTQPILGDTNSLFTLFRESFELTSSEAYWTLGIQVKAFYRFRQRANQRIDAPTSILIRYLFRYPGDIELFIRGPGKGSEILARIQQEDPSFKLSQLGPLFGASRVMSYAFANDNIPCPFFARRLAGIFRQRSIMGEPIYRQIRDCVEDELQARGLNSVQFWRDGRWHE
ncbi:hypothetical protein [Marinobacter sp. HL-58]|uniref:hypothetical protein n=1 Tax=Marinobacter sp. HL-58 TaxID=1479237 RepID=UPI0004828E4C|nr:hypothetical protein [Marinobacter sp. HL-58]KPP97814.1 MAG: hypothetical protein HLUCCO03_09250 [Marinobacter sp. HL-58]